MDETEEQLGLHVV